LKGIQYLLDEVASKLPNAKNAKPEQFVDLSLLQQLNGKVSSPKWQNDTPRSAIALPEMRGQFY
jgi:hypothetical protein